MRIVAFITEGTVIREFLGYLGEPISAPALAPACYPPLWELLVAGNAGREIGPQVHRCQTTSSTSMSPSRHGNDKVYRLARGARV
jgi:hypothetical protein